MEIAKSPYLSVVIPAYNESENFKAGVLNPVADYLKKQKYSWEVILVDDGSSDSTNQLLTKYCGQNPGFNLMKIKHGGKAAAVTSGVLSANGQVILFTDFDQSTPISEVGKFIDRHKQGADVVISYRLQRRDTLIAKVRGWLFVTLVQVVALPGIIDSQCGFKSFTANSAKHVFNRLIVSKPRGMVSGGYMGAFDVEVLFLARKFGYRIDQLPVAWTRFVSSRLNIWKEPIKMALDTFKVRLYDILGRYASSVE